MVVALGADHGGFELKEEIKSYLEKKDIEYRDCGTFSAQAIDYADVAQLACNAIINGECDCGILFCGTGVGISMAANKINGIRAACCSDTFSARHTRLHNDANVLCLGGRVVGKGLAEDMVDLFLNTEFEGGRHQRRVDKIMALENK